METNRGSTALLRQGSWKALLIQAALLCGAAGFTSGNAFAAPDEIRLPQSGTLTDIKQHALYRPDPEGELSAEELLDTSEGFQAYDPAWEDNAPPMWIKLQFRAPPGSNDTYMLLVKRRFFQQFDLYIQTGTGQTIDRHSGIDNYNPTRLFAQSFVYELEPGPTGVIELLIHTRIYQQRLGPLTLSIQDETTFERDRSTALWSYGLYFGAMLALIFYNFVLYLNLRTRGHRWYVATMVVVILFMGLDSGLIQSALPEFLRDREPLYYVFAAALMPAATARFLQIFAGTSFHTPRLHRLLSWLAAILAIMGTGSLVAPLESALSFAIIVQLTATLTWILLPIVSVLAALRGSSAGWIFFGAWTAFVLGTLSRSLLSIDLIQRVPAAEYSLYIGSLLEAMILALGLSYRVGQLRTERNRALREQHKAARLANVDSLTSAYNRRFIENYLDGLLNAEDRRAFQGSLIMLDLDDFKPVNDEYGHGAGDAVLQEMARRCLTVLRSEDVLARLGGDEFAIVLPDQSSDQAEIVAERIRSEISDKPVFYGMQPLHMSVSIGIVTKFEPGASSYSAFKHADEALYQAKRAGKNRTVVFTGGAESQRKFESERDGTEETHI